VTVLRLGLIGDNIRRSKSPLLHRLAGELCGIEVSYEALIPADLGRDFDSVFEACRTSGFRGINITYPYKEEVFPRLAVGDPRVRAIGACNTVVFGPDGARGFNTDYTGFVQAFRAALPGRSPGAVAMAGAGGVGKAIAFGLADLGATRLGLFDPDAAKATRLAEALRPTGMPAVVASSVEAACAGADGLVNCTPLGMAGIPGTAIPSPLMAPARWAFDAVYTPVDTQFLNDARAAGLQAISGYELFFHQGIAAFELFAERRVDAGALRRALQAQMG
jgi:shikimate dehydrogenase